MKRPRKYTFHTLDDKGRLIAYKRGVNGKIVGGFLEFPTAEQRQSWIDYNEEAAK